MLEKRRKRRCARVVEGEARSSTIGPGERWARVFEDEARASTIGPGEQGGEDQAERRQRGTVIEIPSLDEDAEEATDVHKLK
ncbi:hypothetical protein R1sor_005200 [Riccia sorocarpa]|uniref:Uncharacterized protein n=1 Tax=Riccia sorocarpa TaxID=122646 RepID=A0ABD3HQD8_9MARC